MMHRALQLLIVVGEAAFVAFVGSVALVFVATVLVPTIGAAVWLFRKLRVVHLPREARAMSVAFAVCTPIFMGVSMVLGEVTGGYGEALTERPLFGAIGAFVGAFLITAFLSFVLCALVLRVTKLTMDVEKNDSSSFSN